MLIVVISSDNQGTSRIFWVSLASLIRKRIQHICMHKHPFLHEFPFQIDSDRLMCSSSHFFSLKIVLFLSVKIHHLPFFVTSNNFYSKEVEASAAVTVKRDVGAQCHSNSNL